MDNLSTALVNSAAPAIGGSGALYFLGQGLVIGAMAVLIGAAIADAVISNREG